MATVCVCGIARAHRVNDFVIKALHLTQIPPKVYPSDTKPARAIPAARAEELGRSFQTVKYPVIGETADSWIFAEKTSEIGDVRRTHDGESLKTAPVDGPASTQALREYDCKSRKYRSVIFWAWLRPLFDGQNVRPLNPSEEWVSPSAGSVGELLVNAVCAAS